MRKPFNTLHKTCVDDACSWMDEAKVESKSPAKAFEAAWLKIMWRSLDRSVSIGSSFRLL